MYIQNGMVVVLKTDFALFDRRLTLSNAAGLHHLSSNLASLQGTNLNFWPKPKTSTMSLHEFNIVNALYVFLQTVQGNIKQKTMY